MESKFSPSRLPAKKRKSPAFCLPAKKRIWAIQPFDLNLEYEPDIPELKIEETNNEIPRSEIPESTEISDDDDGIVCAVCDNTDGDPTNPIVLCDGCDLMVHSACYGHPLTKGIPEGDWFCAQCTESKSGGRKTEVSCCLCPNSGGALKETTDGRWAHLVCAIYVPEVFFEDPEGKEGIDCSKVLKQRWDRKCCVCKSRNGGCVVDCSEPKCPLAFHVSCGLKEDLYMDYKQRKNKGGVVVAFCRPHSDLWEKQEQTGKYKIVPRDEI